MNKKPMFALSLAIFVVSLGYGLVFQPCPSTWELWAWADGSLVGYLSDRFQEKTLIGIGLIGGAACLFAMTLTSGFVSVIVVLCMFALTVALTVPTLNGVLS